MTDLDVSSLVNGTAALAVVFGVAFAVVQVRQTERKRREAAAFEVMRSLQGPETAKALIFLASLPEGLSPEDYEQREGFVSAMATITALYESLGAMVHRRIVPLDVVESISGGILRVVWRKVKPYAEAQRKVLGLPAHYEWLQWLAERLEENESQAKRVGAHIAYRDWRP